MNKPVDTMEVGANGLNLATAALRRHPIEDLQKRQGVSRKHHLANQSNDDCYKDKIMWRIVSTGLVALALHHGNSNRFVCD